MKGWKKLSKDNLPKLNAVIELTDGDQIITAKWLGDGYRWIPRHYQNGVCLVVKPTHWR